MIHLYAFVRGLRELDAGLESRPIGRACAVVGREEPDPLRHGLVVERLLDCAEAVLPVRYGQRFADDEELTTAVVPRLEALEQQLDHVAGCVEVGVRVVRRHEPGQEADGAAYMRARLREETSVEAVHRVLAEQARDSVRTSRDAGYLVSRSEVAGFSASVERLVAAHPALDVLCTGPWAPYSFGAAT